MKKVAAILIVATLSVMAGCFFIPKLAVVVSLIETVLISSFLGVVIIPMFYDHRITRDDKSTFSE